MEQFYMAYFTTSPQITYEISLQAGVESKATHSVRVPVKNLRAADPSLDVATLQGAFGNEFLRYARSKDQKV